MKRTVTPAILALAVGLLVGAFVGGPLLSPTATAQDKDKKAPEASKGKCVGMQVVPAGKDGVMIYRAFEDGTVEFIKSSTAGSGKWAPDKK